MSRDSKFVYPQYPKISDEDEEFKRLALLRCEFAVMLLHGFLSGSSNVYDLTREVAAREAVSYADALIAELLKPKEDLPNE